MVRLPSHGVECGDAAPLSPARRLGNGSPTQVTSRKGLWLEAPATEGVPFRKLPPADRV